MRLLFATSALVLGFAVASFACSSSSGGGSGSAEDAGPEASTVKHDSGSGFGSSGGLPDSGGSDASDGGICAQLQAQVEQLGQTARACNPSAASAQCNATTMGPCCPITVSTGDPGPLENYDQAVQKFVQQCAPNCGIIVCPPAPSNVCDGTGSTGTCR